MVKLVRGQDNVISLHITSTYPVGEVSGTFVAKSVTIPVPQSRNGTEIKVAAADVEAIGEDFMIGVMTLKNEANEEVAVVRVPLAVLPEGSDNRGFTDVRITLVSIREVEGGDHGGAGVKMFPTKGDFPVKGNVRYIYLAEDTGKMYRWDAAIEDYVEVSGVVHANLAENNPGNDGYVLNRSTRNLVNEGCDGTHPYVSVANFVPDYDSAKAYSKDEVVLHSWKVKEPDVYENGIFKCLEDGTTVAPPDSSKWVEVDIRNFFHNEIIVSDDGDAPTGGEEIWIDEAEIPESQSYNDLVDKPQINGHELTGNKTSRQLGIVDTTDLDKKLSKQRVDGDATKGKIEWMSSLDGSGILKLTKAHIAAVDGEISAGRGIFGKTVKTIDGKHNLSDKANATDLEKIIPYGYYDESAGKFYKSYDKSTGTFSDEITGQANRIYVDLLTDTMWKCDPTTPAPFSKFVRVDDHLDDKSTNPVQNKKVTEKFSETDGLIAGNAANIARNLNLISDTRIYKNHGAWDGSASYLESDDFVVSHDEAIPGGTVTKYYKCIADCVGIEPPNADYWVEVGQDRTISLDYQIAGKVDKATIFAVYAQEKSYLPGNIVVKDDVLYKCKTAVDAGSEWDEAKWETAGIDADSFVADLIGNPVANVKANTTALAPAFDATKTYAVDEVVTHDGNLYRCTTAVTTAGEWAGSTNWTLDTATHGDTAFLKDAQGHLVIRETEGQGSAQSQTLYVDAYRKWQDTTTHVIKDAAISEIGEIAANTTLALPPAITGHCRDFVVEMKIGATVPTFTFPLVEADLKPYSDEIPTWAANTTYCIAFTEFPDGKWRLGVASKTEAAE